MSDSLKLTSELLRVTRNAQDFSEAGFEKLKGHFLACYDELEKAAAPLAAIADLAFDGLDASQPNVALFRRVALEIARRVDRGDDNTGENAYHNALHFAKVVVNFRALAELHNRLHPEDALTDENIAAGLLAAVAHDLCHNGRGNTVDGQHRQFRLEQLAIDKALEWSGVTGEERERVRAALMLILATDVSSDGRHIAPAHWVRKSHHAQGNNECLPETPYAAMMARIFDSRAKILAGSLLQDADVLASSMASDAHEREHGRYDAEMERSTGKRRTPDSSRYFFVNVLQGRLTTGVARGLTDSFVKARFEAYQQG